jgi:bidirectional [NiFe] hydrogenase diaphorase subunit
MSAISITIDGKKVDVPQGHTILDACRQAGADLPVLCDLKGLGAVGACRLCLVELEGTAKLLPACTTPVAANQVIRTQSERLQKNRRMILELLFSERNHICSVCVANNHCELQKLGYRLGMEHVRFPYLYQECQLDASHEKFIIDHNHCILCTRCVRVCDEVEGAHTWDVMGRGYQARVITDFLQPWGDSTTCTSCGKCAQVCPVGAIFPKKTPQGMLEKNPETISELVEKRKAK